MLTSGHVRGGPLHSKQSYATLQLCSTARTRRRYAQVIPRASARAVRTGPTGLDVLDPDRPGKTYRPTSPAGWEIISNTIKSKGIKFISPQEVRFATEQGIPVVDVRPKSEYIKGHIPGAANVQYYRLIEGWSLWKSMRRIGFTFFGVVGTEPNEDFLDQSAAAITDPLKGAVLVCNLGGNLDPDYGPSKFGYQTRILWMKPLYISRLEAKPPHTRISVAGLRNRSTCIIM